MSILQTTIETRRHGLLTVKQTADLLGVCTRTVWNLTAPRGPLAAVRVGRALRYDPADVQAFVEQNRRGKHYDR